MSTVITTQNQGIRRIMKTGLVLLLTFAVMFTSHNGLLSPRCAEAVSIGNALNAFPATPQVVSDTAAATATGAVTVTAGTNRMMLVVVGTEYSTAPSSIPLTVTFGGQTVTMVESTFAGCTNCLWVGYLNNAGLTAASGTTLSVTNGNTTNLVAMYASAAVYQNVNQATPFTGSSAVTSNTAVNNLTLPSIFVRGAAGNTAQSLYFTNRAGQVSTADAAYTKQQDYAGTNFNMSFNQIITPPAALGSTAPVANTATASVGSAIVVALFPTALAGGGAGVIQDCGGCHFYPGTSNTVADGARSGVTGDFLGNHVTHVGQYNFVCTKCHRNDNTAIGNNHQNGFISLSSSLLPGSAYNNNGFPTHTKPVSNSPTLYACYNTYCHSNGTSVISGVIPANTSPFWGSAAGSLACTGCHGVGGGDDGRPNYTNGAPKRNTHGDGVSYGVTHKAQTCNVCHDGIGGTTGAYTIISTSHHNNGAYNIRNTLGYTQATGTCSTPGCHSTATWGGPALTCLNCHSSSILSPVAQALDATVTSRRAIFSEFSSAGSTGSNRSEHLRTRTGRVTANDCGVCHMEGNASDGSKNMTYHGNGYVELRDPVTGSTINATAFLAPPQNRYTSVVPVVPAKFVRFSRNLTITLESDTAAIPGTTINNFNVIGGIQKNLCLKCHSATGATNALARITAGAATRPWNNASSAVNVASQFATTNRSYHPVAGKGNNSYTQGTRMVAPWTIAKTNGNTTSYGYLISCWDCHAKPTDTTITSTVTAHGSTITAATGSANSVELRDVNWRTGAITAAGNNAGALCLKCHGTAYNTNTTSNHGAGSAFSAGGGSSMSVFLRYGCVYCHSQGPTPGTNSTMAMRRRRSGDVHGYDTTNMNGTFPAGHGYAFLRNALWNTTGFTPTHQVGATTYTLGCATFGTNTNGTTSCGGGNMGGDSWSVGGVY